MVNKKIFFLFLLMFTFTFVSAQQGQGGSTQVNINSAQGLQIFYPDFSVVKLNQSFDLYIHATNISTGFSVNNSLVNCTLELYNVSGGKIVDIDLNPTDADGEYYLHLEGTNFSNIGFQAWKLYCHDEIIGGTASGTVEVTNQGFVLSEGSAIIYSVGTLMILLLLFVQLYYVTVLPWKNREEGEIFVIEWRKYLKLFLMFSTYITILFLMYIGKGMSYAFLQSTEIYGFFNVASLIMIVMLLPLVALGLTLGIIKFLVDKKIQQAIIRGVPIR